MARQRLRAGQGQPGRWGGVLGIGHASGILEGGLGAGCEDGGWLALRHKVSEEGDCYSQEALCGLQRNCSAPV